MLRMKENGLQDSDWDRLDNRDRLDNCGAAKAGMSGDREAIRDFED